MNRRIRNKSYEEAKIRDVPGNTGRLASLSAVPIQSRVPNLKSLAQVVLEILTPHWLTSPTTSKQRLRPFILVPIDFLYTTSIVTFALGRNV